MKHNIYNVRSSSHRPRFWGEDCDISEKTSKRTHFSRKCRNDNIVVDKTNDLLTSGRRNGRSHRPLKSCRNRIRRDLRRDATRRHPVTRHRKRADAAGYCHRHDVNVSIRTDKTTRTRITAAE